MAGALRHVELTIDGNLARIEIDGKEAERVSAFDSVGENGVVVLVGDAWCLDGCAQLGPLQEGESTRCGGGEDWSFVDV